jgi:hypothetical protein
MPISLTAVGPLLDAVVVDDNFGDIQDLLRSGLDGSDFTGKIDRYRIRRYTSGKIVSASAGCRPFARDAIRDSSGNRSQRGMFDSVFDLSFSPAAEELLSTYNIGVSDLVEGLDQRHYQMEVLGRPGPSFYLDWQEDGYSEPVTSAGWPPTGWPFTKWPTNLCYSRWLTCPGAAVRVFTDQPCVAKIRATVLVSANMFRILCLWKWSYDNSLPDPFTNDPPSNRLNTRWLNFMRFGLFVDTNPNLYPDEFENDNQNIPAGFVSWKKIQDRTFEMGQRQIVTLEAEVTLKGRRFYNFSLKYKDAATHGWVDAPHDEGTEFHSGFFESSAKDYAERNPDWQAYMPPDAAVAGFCWYPSWINLWETTSIDVEFRNLDEAYAQSA